MRKLLTAPAFVMTAFMFFAFSGRANIEVAEKTYTYSECEIITESNSETILNAAKSTVNSAMKESSMNFGTGEL